MNALSRLGVAALLASTASFAQAESSVYGGISTAFTNVDILGVDFDLNTAQLQVGYSFNEHIAIEGRVGLGIGDDSVEGNGQKVTLEVDTVASVFAKFIAPVGDAEFYALAGMTHAKLEASATGLLEAGETDSDQDFSYGIGAAYNVNDSYALFLEYINLYDKNEVDATAITLGFNAKF